MKHSRGFIKHILCFFILLFFSISNLGSANEIDVEGIVSYIAKMHEHGYGDNSKSFEESLKISKQRKLQMTCTAICNFTINLCNRLGIKTRLILLLTLDEWNSYNNGHSLVEIFNDGKWKLWDIDLKNYFTLKGADLNAYQFCQAVSQGSYEIIRFSDEIRNLEGQDLTKIYQRVAQIPLIKEGANFYFTSNEDVKQRIKSYNPSFVYMEKSAFLKRFYN